MLEDTTPKLQYPITPLLPSVNAKQLEQPALQADPSRCESGHGCHSVRVAQLESERHLTKVEVAGATPAADAILPGLWCNSSISACEADGPGANPGFLTISIWM